MHQSFSISSTTSALSLTSISVVADNLLRLQGCSPGKRFLVTSHDDGPPIVIDSGASYSVTPLESDFIQGTFVNQSYMVAQLSSTVLVAGHGQAHWRFPSSDGGSPHELLPLNTHLIPSANIRLFSPQAYIHQTKQGSVLLDITGCTLTLPGGRSRHTPFHINNNLPLLHSVSIHDDPLIFLILLSSLLQICLLLFFQQLLLMRQIKISPLVSRNCLFGIGV